MSTTEASTAPTGAPAALTPGLLTVVCDRDTRIIGRSGTWAGGATPGSSTLRELIHPDDHDLVGSVLAGLRRGHPVDHAVGVHIDVAGAWEEAAMIAAANGEDLVFSFVAVLPDPAPATIEAVFAERELAATLDEALHGFADIDHVWGTVHHGVDADTRLRAVTAATGMDTFRRAVEAAVAGDEVCPWDREHLDDEPLVVGVDELPDGLKMAGRHAGIGTVVLLPIQSVLGDDAGCLALWCDGPHRLDLADVSVVVERTMQAVTLAFQIESGRDGIRRLATRDPLTGLWNRQAFFGQLRALKANRSYTVASIDIDGFAGVNARFGHAVGDEVLLEAANRLREAVRPGDVIARVSADEFAVLCPDVRTEDAAAAIAERITAIAARPFTMAGTPTELSLSVGVAVADDAQSGPALFSLAEKAMLETKATAHGSWMFAGPVPPGRRPATVGSPRATGRPDRSTLAPCRWRSEPGSRSPTPSWTSGSRPAADREASTPTAPTPVWSWCGMSPRRVRWTTARAPG